jgi:hypothetical protein
MLVLPICGHGTPPHEPGPQKDRLVLVNLLKPDAKARSRQVRVGTEQPFYPAHLAPTRAVLHY